MNLRPYQVRGLEMARQAAREGARSILLVSPTGSGKTTMFSHMTASHVAKGGKVNVYAHRRELTRQAADTLRRFGLEVGHGGLNPSAPVQVLSVQGVLSSGEVPDCTMAILDEAHHFSADDWARIPAGHKGAILIGATATPERGDSRPLKPPFERLIVVAQVKELVAQGHLVPSQVIRPARKLKPDQIAQTPAAAYGRYAPRGRAVVFAPHVKAAEDYAAGFAPGVAEVIHGKLGGDERQARLERFERGDTQVLVSVMVLTEGWDCPAADTCIIARSCGSTGMYLQMVGRVLRPHPGKTKALVIDLRGVSYEHGRPDDLREFSLDGIAISRGTGAGVGERLCVLCKKPLGLEMVCPHCGKDHSLETPESINAPLVHWSESMQGDTIDTRAARLAKWYREAIAKGHKMWSAHYRYKGTYKELPPRDVQDAARRLVG